MITIGLIHALSPDARRGYDRKEAASYVGVSPTHFDKLARAGTMPQPNQFLGRKVWDVRALDRVLDTLQGIGPRQSAGAHDMTRTSSTVSSPTSRQSMVTLELKGLHRVTAKGRIYWCAWRGGPRLVGEPGAPDFMASCNEAITDRQSPDAGRFRALVTLYKASADYKKLADSTRRNWGPWLDQIADHFGELRIAQFDRTDKIRPIIRRWRATYAETPRTADYGMQVLSRVLSHAVDPLGRIASNPCEGIKQLYSSSRAEIIWTDANIAHMQKTCSAEIAHAVDLAAHTG